VKAIERTIRAELRGLGVSLRSSVGARAAVDLARRMDAEPGDRSAVMLSRELRLVMADLRSRVKGGGTDDVERFLARIAAPHVGHATH
jgi:hypothetical protein